MNAQVRDNSELFIDYFHWLISNGNRIERSPIWSVIIPVGHTSMITDRIVVPSQLST